MSTTCSRLWLGQNWNTGMLTEQEVRDEIVRSRKLHGPLRIEPERAALILARECLEALQEAHFIQNAPRCGAAFVAARSRLRSELVQVVAVASQWVTNLDIQEARDNSEAEHHKEGERA